MTRPANVRASVKAATWFGLLIAIRMPVLPPNGWQTSAVRSMKGVIEDLAQVGVEMLDRERARGQVQQPKARWSNTTSR